MDVPRPRSYTCGVCEKDIFVREDGQHVLHELVEVVSHFGQHLYKIRVKHFVSRYSDDVTIWHETVACFDGNGEFRFKVDSSVRKLKQGLEISGHPDIVASSSAPSRQVNEQAQFEMIRHYQFEHPLFGLFAVITIDVSSLEVGSRARADLFFLDSRVNEQQLLSLLSKKIMEYQNLYRKLPELPLTIEYGNLLGLIWFSSSWLQASRDKSSPSSETSSFFIVLMKQELKTRCEPVFRMFVEIMESFVNLVSLKDENGLFRDIRSSMFPTLEQLDHFFKITAKTQFLDDLCRYAKMEDPRPIEEMKAFLLSLLTEIIYSVKVKTKAEERLVLEGIVDRVLITERLHEVQQKSLRDILLHMITGQLSFAAAYHDVINLDSLTDEIDSVRLYKVMYKTMELSFRRLPRVINEDV